MVVEQRLQDGLAVIESAFDGDVVDDWAIHRRHLAALDIADPALGMKNEDGGMPARLEGLDGGAAGVARGGADDGCARAALVERPVHQAGQELHRHILEGERRPVEKFEQPMIGIDLLERRDRGMVESCA